MSVPKSFRALLGRAPATVSPADRDSILVIIDAQNEYAHGLLKISDETIAYSRPNILTLLQRYRAAHAPVAHVVHVTPAGAPVFTPDTPLAEVFPELAPQLDRTSPDAPDLDFEVMVPKRFPGSFAETILDDVVKRAGVKKVVLTGYMAHVCVSTTAREAAQRGYDVLVVGDAVGDRDIPVVGGCAPRLLGATGEEVTKMVLIELADAFATVLRTEDVK
ncbi:isochorismatase hydrolase [Mycena sanguinolenta]|nr:isochorismatase hydrolase [Mycena sanguinolenta]